jgi:hypothetical protein
MIKEFAQLENETTSVWLKRLIYFGAPADIRADVRAILEAETEELKIQLSALQKEHSGE